MDVPRPTASIYVLEQKRSVTRAIKRELKRRAAVEPVIGRLKSDHRMDRNYLIGSHGDAANAVLAAVGYNFARLVGWLRQLLCAWLSLLIPPAQIARPPCPSTSADRDYFTDAIHGRSEGRRDQGVPARDFAHSKQFLRGSWLHHRVVGFQPLPICVAATAVSCSRISTIRSMRATS